MKKINRVAILAIILNLWGTMAFGTQRSYDEIKNVAINFANKHQKKLAFTVDEEVEDEPIILTQLNGYDSNPEDNEYAIVKLKPKGWVIVSTDDIAKPILGYSFDGDIEKNQKLPPAFVSWMNAINEEIRQGKKANTTNKKYKSKWDYLASDPSDFLETLKEKKFKTTASSSIVGPLLRTTWNQRRYYNELCPIIEGSNSHVPVGCVATAMVQIMRYHSWPKKGEGSHRYTHETYGEQYANFTTNYNWSAMPLGKVKSPNHDVAKIAYHAGVSVDMNYSPRGSGATVYKPDYAFKTYFKYKTLGYFWKSEKSDAKSHKKNNAEWHKMLKRDLDNRLPIYYGGFGTGGHAFVCDGYQYENDSKRYHFNWGWGGSGDGWFTIGALNIYSYHFNQRNIAIFGITPNKNTTPSSPSNLTANSITSNSAHLTWRDNSNNESGFKIYKGSTHIATVGKDVTNYNLINLTPNTSYKYSIKSYNKKGNSNASIVTFTTHKAQPKITRISFNHTINEKWDSKTKSKNRNGRYAKFYKFTLKERAEVTIDLMSKVDTYLYLFEGEKTSGQRVKKDDDGGSGRNSRIKMTLKAGTYTIEATTFSPHKTGLFHIRVSIAPISAPYNLLLSSRTSTSVQLIWQDNSNNESGFKIYRGSTLVGTVNRGVNRYTITGLKPNTIYTYSVKAYNRNISSSATTLTFRTKPKVIYMTLNQIINGKWDSKTKSKNKIGSYSKFYTFQLKKRTTVTIDLMSRIDTYLYLFKGTKTSGQRVKKDDDGGSGRNSRIKMTLDKGTYTIDATTFSSHKSGSFKLRVTTQQ